MAEAIKFEKKQGNVIITINVEEAMKGRTSKGNPGCYGQANVPLDNGHDVRLSLNVYQTKRKAQPVTL